jgi:hypothetical protein
MCFYGVFIVKFSQTEILLAGNSGRDVQGLCGLIFRLLGSRLQIPFFVTFQYRNCMASAGNKAEELELILNDPNKSIT